MLEKMPLKIIPEEIKFEYLKLHRDISKIKKELQNFNPETDEQSEWIKEKLKQYSKIFNKISYYNHKIKSS